MDQSHVVEGQSRCPDEVQDPTQGPTQWPFWTPMAFHQSQGAPSRASQSAYSESRAPEAMVSRSPLEAPDPPAQSSAEIPDPEASGLEASEFQQQDLPQDSLVPGLSSSSSPDEAVAGASSSGPPPIDLRDHQDLLRRLALNMNLQVEEVVELEDPVVDILTVDAPTQVALPFIRTIHTNAISIWQSPASIPPTARGVERKYMAPPKDFEYLYTHPQPCSLVVQSVNERERDGQQAPAPKSKDAKRLDLFGRKIYLGGEGGLQLRVANQQALLSQYNYNTWNSMQKFKEFVPQESRQEYSALIEEGKKVARTSFRASLDIADSAARTIASGVAMRRISWLQSSTLPPEVQYTIQDLLFEGRGLFSEKTDARLQTLKDGLTIIRTLGMHTLATQRRPFRPFAQRPYTVPRPQQDFSRRPRGRGGRRRQPGHQTGQSQGPHKPSTGPKQNF
ncbi:uncharacterized protein RBU57_011009 isoform 1-T2 [Macrochelys suwanniensis]